MKLTSKYAAQKQLSILWFIASAIFITLFLLISIPRTDPGSTETFEWLLNFISPTLSLITSAFVYSANNREALLKKNIDTFFVRMVMLSSIFYLGFLFTVLLITPFSDRADISFINHIKRFSLILGFIQTILVVLLGIFFVKEESWVLKINTNQGEASIETWGTDFYLNAWGHTLGLPNFLN